MNEEYVDINGISYADFKEEVESDDWSGIDASNEISLGEYHILIKDNSFTEEGDILVIYFNPYTRSFEKCVFNVYDIIDNLSTENEKGLRSYADIKGDLREYAKEYTASFLSDIDSYFGLYTM